MGKKIFQFIVGVCMLSLYRRFPVFLKRICMKTIHFCFQIRKIKIHVNLADHCNLNCKGCGEYSPIAEKGFIDPRILERDFLQLKKIFKKHISQIKLLGGEPLLNPDIESICVSARNIFKEEKIIIITNGLLIPKMQKSFFDCCRENDIIIMFTKYPIQFDYDGWYDKVNAMGVKCSFYNKEPQKTLYRQPVDLAGKQNPKEQFDLCLLANRCVFLKEGRLYTCSTIPTICHFNKFFKQNLEVTQDDYIDIFSVTNYREIRKRLNRSVPFCRFCKIKGEQFGIPWETSKKDIKEWADVE